ncbi:MAG: hypothetical protein VKJ64_17535 [Leptolyngbyaceae bacterium]|nr:hypothetical protein [Leptolyngbyaceae bacterium]
MGALTPWLPLPRGCPYAPAPRSCDRTVDTGRARGHRPNQTSGKAHPPTP